VPIGAVIVDGSGRIIAKSTNLREKLKSTLGHAELVAVHRACKKVDSWRLIDCTLYVTLEPCFMCAGALVQARIKRVVYGALDPKGGALHSLHTLGNDSRLNHSFKVTGGVCAEESSAMLKNFFRKKRKVKI
jgi:tRNA(adenine34) deaminase